MPFFAFKSITLRLRIAFLIVAATTLFAGLAAIWAFRSVNQTYSNISNESYPATRAIANLETNSLELALSLQHLSAATDNQTRQKAFEQLQQLLQDGPEYISALKNLQNTRSNELTDQFLILSKQVVETNRIVEDLIEIDAEHKIQLREVDQKRQSFEALINPLLDKAQEDLLLATGKTSSMAGQEWSALNEREKINRDGLSLIRADVFRLQTLISAEGEDGYKKKSPEILARLEKNLQQMDPDIRSEGQKMLQILRAPMGQIGREASAAMLIFYRSLSKITQRQNDEVSHSGDVIAQNTTSAVVALVNTQVQTLTAIEQIKSDYFQLGGDLRQMASAENMAQLDANEKAFERTFLHAMQMSHHISSTRMKSSMQGCLALFADYKKLKQEIHQSSARRINFSILLDKIVNDNRRVTNALLSTTKNLAHDVSGNLNGKVSMLDTDLKQSTRLLFASTILGMLVALVVGWIYVSRNISRRLERLAGSMRLLSQGQLGDEIDARGNDEISDIEHGVAQFRTVLQQQQAQTEALRQARDDAHAAVQIKSEFLANMSHEIRTPLTAILGYTNLLAENGLNSQQQQYIARAQNSAQMLLGVVNDVLDFSRIEANKLEIEQQPFNLMQLFSQLAGTVAIQAQEKGLFLRFEIAPDVPTMIEGDALRLGQVLLNLLNNAVKFTEQGDVCLSVFCIEHSNTEVRLHFAVQDSGIGISPEAQERLFKLFSQADSSTTRRFGGSGLGLAISQQLIHLMGGHIQVQSHEGLGAQFSFELDLNKAGADQFSPMQYAPRRALIAERNPEIARHLALHLQAMGFEATLLNNQAQLLAYFAAGHVTDLLILEVNLCGAQQHPLCDVLQSLHQAGLPIILLCYDRDDIAATQESQLRHCQLLIKPLIPSQIRSAVAQSLADDAAELHGQLLDKASQFPLQGLRVLLVDDTDILLDLGATILGNMGAQVSAVSSGNAAIAALMSQEIDVVLMDVQMPGMDGRDTTRAIRALPGFADLPIIALTAHAMEGERELCLQAGMNEHLSKPIDAAKLQNCLRVYLPATQPVSVTSLPTVEASTLVTGVDFLAAIQRMGSLRMLKKMLPRFVERFANAPTVLRELIADGQLAEAERLAHTLKGVAGQVEANEVAATAADLEQCLHQGQVDVTAQIGKLELLLGEACSLIERWLAAHEQEQEDKSLA
ncbi:response regulator [Chitinibacter bivalviorum]|uniref:Sensory/regulatory protein RpfC n=1 Tax=Chitinibacter bivalviorum TaxID=2739434 RepID=A0A7H9BEG1_9NEIS|nr:response regulator [Chitinibacter bivalviorum]QLG86985.1 response regulator [Chitinibacter bivalviorum]